MRCLHAELIVKRRCNISLRIRFPLLIFPPHYSESGLILKKALVFFSLFLKKIRRRIVEVDLEGNTLVDEAGMLENTRINNAKV